jgi:hypothetical protein
MGLMTASTGDDNLLDYYSTDDDPEIRQHIRNPLGLISWEEALRLCKVFAEETNIMYPLLDMDKIMNHIEALRSVEDAKGSWMSAGDDKDIIVLVMAISLMRESAGESELGRSLFHSIRNNLEKKIWAPISLTSTSSIVLAVGSHSFDSPRVQWLK